MKLKFPKNKWFYAFLIAAIVAIVAAVVAIVIAVNANRPPEVPDEEPTVEGEKMSGVYYYDVEGGEVVLTLSDSYTFTIAGPGINKTGTYTLEGTTIHLDFFKDEDGVTTATLSGDSLSLIYGDATMSFAKKVNYTVTFQTNGGSEIPAVSVVNGKTVAKPDDPTKENNVFLGWYADEALTTPYAFTTMAIKTDTTVYAKWAAKTVGVAEYTVWFDLGYEGGVAPEAITTISGKAHGVVTPEREGYTFGGWWISMYEDGTKLSYAYTEDTVFTANTTLFAVWYDNASTKLNAPAVTVTESMISWSTVEGATGYLLTVTAPDGTVLINNETVGATGKAYSFVNMPAGEYKVSVVAVAAKSENNSDAAVRSYANKMLDRVSQFQVVNGILVFNAVENAQKYLITIDCGNDQHVHTKFDNGRSTTYYLANCPMQKGGILITVIAMADGYASSVSEKFVYDLTLPKIDNVVYSKDNDTFVWDIVPGAMRYLVTVTVDGSSKTFDNGTLTTFSVASFTGNITVSVVPASEGYNSPEATEATCVKTAPATPDGLTLSGMVISWNAAAGATSYEVKVGEETAIVNTNSIDLAQTSLSLAQGAFYEVQVKAINEANDASSYSAAMKFGYFVMDTVLSYNKNTVTWTPVLGVTEFKVSVQGGATFTVEGQNSARVTLPRAGENVITVKYIYDGTESDVATVTVVAHTVEYDTRSSDGSLFEYLAVGDELSLPVTGFEYPGYTFACWSNAPMGAAGNGTLYGAGSVFNGNAHTVLYATWTPKDYKVSLQTDGSKVNFDNITDGQEETVTFGQPFTLSVPEVPISSMYYFVGWFTGMNGQGIQLTDGTGASLKPYTYTNGIDAYAHFDYNALSFTMQTEGAYAGTYMVTRGASIENVTDIVIPEFYNGIEVTVIKEKAFNGATNLRTVKFPDTIQLVGAEAFNHAPSLESIEVYKASKEGNYEVFYFSENDSLIRKDAGSGGLMDLECVPRAKTGDYIIPTIVDRVMPHAFNYTKISSVVIPNNVISLPEFAFNACPDLKTVTFEFGRTNPFELEGEVFASCVRIETMVFPANLSLELDALRTLFVDLVNLKSIVVEDGGEMYGAMGGMLTDAAKTTLLYCPKAFQGALTIPTGITTIAERAFSGCTAITSVTIPARVTAIEKEAFSGAVGIQNILFAGDRRANLSIGQAAFSGLTALQTIVFDGNEDGELEVGVISMGQSAFAASSASSAKLQTVIIGAGTNLASFSDSAFYNQTKLESVIIGKGARVGKISTNAFAGCTSLASFNVPSTVTSIEKLAFDNCTSLATLTFDQEGTDALSIANDAFHNCTMLSSVTLPDRLDKFETSAFRGCIGIKEIKVNNTNPKYMNDANGILYVKETDEGGNPVFSELLFYPMATIIANNGVITDLPTTITTIGGMAFANNPDLVSVTLPASLKNIKTSAFANCYNLVDVIFLVDETAEGMSLTIGEEAFTNCEALSDNLVFPAYTKTISKNAFRGAGFTTFVVPAGVTSIGEAAFLGCQNLETVIFNCTGSVYLADGVATATETGGGVFAECTALKTVTIPAGMTAIGNYAFMGCTALETVIMPTENATLTRIGNGAFQNCTALQSITIPASVKAIGDDAFAAKETATGSLSEITFADGGTETLHIGKNAFQYQAKLSTITFPARVSLPSAYEETATDANGNKTYKAPVLKDYLNQVKRNEITNLFKGCTALAEINLVAGGTGYSSVDGVLYSADGAMLIYCPAANVGTNNKEENPTYELIVPTSVTLVMSGAFQSCTQLKTVTFAEFDEIPEGTTLTIGHYPDDSYEAPGAIGGTSTISLVKLPAHLTKIGAYAFASDSGVAMAITFNENANVTLAPSAFADSAISELKLPNCTLTERVFSGASLLTTVVLHDGITNIPDSAFEGATALTTLVLPETVTTIGSKAFTNCTSLKTLDLPSNLKTISTNAFVKSGLVSITIPASVTSFDNRMFENCASLKSVTFEGTIKTIPQFAFNGCIALETVTFAKPDSITTISTYAFQGCKSLVNFDFTLFTSLTTVGTKAFYGTGITKVDLSKTRITKLNDGFAEMPELTEFVFFSFSSSTTIAENAFEGNLKLAKITVPSNFTTALLFDKNGKSPLAYLVANVPDLEIILPSTMTNFVEKDGVLYDKSYQTLYWVLPNVEMETFQIPDTVLTVSSNAFAVSKIQNIIVPTSVTELANYAFAYSSARSITFIDTLSTPSNLETIGEYAFAYSAIESFVFPDSVTCAEEYESNSFVYWFAYCPNLKSITTGANMLSIPDAFAPGTTALEELIMQEGIEYIGWIFNDGYEKPEVNGHQMKSITVPASVTLMWASFSYMDGLETVTFANGSQLAEMWSWVFRGCESLKSITLPENVAYIEDGIFEGCTSLEYVDLSQTLIMELFEYTFAYTTSLKTILFPADLYAIGDRAFYGTGLESITIPATVDTLGMGVFENAKSLKTVTFEEGSMISVLGGDSFALGYGSYPDLTGNNNNIFRGTTSLETVTVPNTITKIASGAFENSSISEFIITGTSKLTTVDKYAFANCTNLTAFNYGSTLTTINEGAFMNCSNLETITLGSTLKTLQGMAFAFCTKLPKGVIPASVTSITGNPYAGLDASKIELGSGSKNFALSEVNGALHLTDTAKTTVYGVWGATGDYKVDYTAATYSDYKMGALAGNAITSITLKPKTTGSSSAQRKEIPSYLLMNCTELTSVTITSGFTAIGDYAFYNTGLTTVAFPTTVTKLGNYAFADCDSLDNVTIPKQITTMGNYCFAYCDTLSKFTFDPATSTSVQTIGTHFFYNCPNITEVILPTVVRINSDDYYDIFPSGSMSNPQRVIPSYMFAGTGIKIAVIPESIMRFYTKGLFANCEYLTEIRIVSDMPTGVGEEGLNPAMFEGCDLDTVTIIWEWVESAEEE